MQQQTTATATNQGPSNPHLLFYGNVYNDVGNPVVDAQVQFWHADFNGNYFHPGDPLDGKELQKDSFSYFGTANTDGEGKFQFKTYRPGIYPSRPVTHIHFKVFHGGRELLTSQFYFQDENVERWFDEMLILTLEEMIDEDGNVFHRTSKAIVVNMNMGGGEKLTPRQQEGPFYPLVDFFNVTSDMTTGLLERFYTTDPLVTTTIPKVNGTPPTQNPSQRASADPSSVPAANSTSTPTATPLASVTAKPQPTTIEQEPSDELCLSLPTTMNVLCDDERFTRFCNLIEQFDLSDFFLPTRDTSLAVFAPTDDAFKALEGNEDFDFDMMTIQESIYVLLYHVVRIEDSTLAFTNIECSGLLKTTNGESTRTKCEGDDKFQRGPKQMENQLPKIIVPYMEACQAIVLGVDHVILPNLDKMPSFEDDADFLPHFAVASGNSSMTIGGKYTLNGDNDLVDNDEDLEPIEDEDPNTTLVDTVDIIGATSIVTRPSLAGNKDGGRNPRQARYNPMRAQENEGDKTEGFDFAVLALSLSNAIVGTDNEGDGIRFLRKGK